MDSTLLSAYSNTDYYVDMDNVRVKLRVDQYSQGLDELQKSMGVKGSAFISAWNPRSNLTREPDNIIAQEALFKDIRALGLECINGKGADPSGKWPGEPSFLALRLTEFNCLKLGKKYGQNAVLFAGPQAILYLVFPFPGEDLS